MSLSAKLLSRLGGSARVDKSPLLELPTELLLDIADLLNMSDLACFSLCNHSLSLKFSRFQGQLRGDDTAKGDFLVRVSRDLPQLFCCHNCLRLHELSSVPAPAFTGLDPPEITLDCVTHPSPDLLNDRPHHIHGRSSAYQLTFQHVHLTMVDDFLTCHLATTEVHRLANPLATTLLSVEAEKINGELYLRVQQWVTYHGAALSRAESMWDVAVCAHINWNVFYTNTALIDIIRCKLNHHDKDEHCQTCRPRLKCKVCATEFQIDTVGLPELRSKALVLTKWLDLGCGQDPSDPRWQQLLSGNVVPRGNSAIVGEVDDSNGVRAVFERSSGKALSELTQENRIVLDCKSDDFPMPEHWASTSARQIYVKPGYSNDDVKPPDSIADVDAANSTEDVETPNSSNGWTWWTWAKLICIVAVLLKIGDGNLFVILVGLAILLLVRACLLRA